MTNFLTIQNVIKYGHKIRNEMPKKELGMMMMMMTTMMMIMMKTVWRKKQKKNEELK